jgi:hypothetical protein
LVDQSEVVFSEDVINKLVFMSLHKTDHRLHFFDLGDLAFEIGGDLLEDSRNFHLALHGGSKHHTTISIGLFCHSPFDEVFQECCKSFHAF